MILVDTSVWADHFRVSDARLAGLLRNNEVMMHPFVLGEIALGHLKNRAGVLNDLGRLKQAPVARDREVLDLVERRQLFGSGIGYVDAHLIAGVLLVPGTLLWTRDQRLGGVAAKLRIAVP